MEKMHSEAFGDMAFISTYMQCFFTIVRSVRSDRHITSDAIAALSTRTLIL
jgi:hypothetical protein